MDKTNTGSARLTAKEPPHSRGAFMRHGMIYWLGRVGSYMVSVLLIPLYTAYIAPDDWGVLSLMMITGDIAALVVGCQLSSAFYRYWPLAGSEHERRRLFGMLLIASIIIPSLAFIPIYIWADWFSSLIGVKGGGAYARLTMATIQFSVILGIIHSELRLRDMSKLYAWFNIGHNIAIAGLSIFFIALMGWGVMGIFTGNIIAFAAVVAVLLPSALRRAELNMDLAQLKRLMGFSYPLIPSAVAMAAIHNIDRYILQAYSGASEVGLYSMGYKFGTMVSLLILGPFMLIWEPKSYEIAARPDAPKKLGEVLSLFAAVALFVAIGLAGASEEIVKVMTAPAYWKAHSVIPIVAISYVLFGLDSVIKIGLLMNKRTKTVLITALIACTANILANLVLIPRFGMAGAAWATFIAFALLLAMDLRLSLKWLPIEFEWRRILPLVFTSVAVLTAMLLVRGMALWVSIGLKLLILASYPCLLYLFNFFDKSLLSGLFRLKRQDA